MRIQKANVVAKRHSWLLAIVACCSVVNAQSILQGQNSVYNSAATTTGSVAFVDASMFALNIRFDTGGDEATTTTECVSLNNLTSTQGVRGLSCRMPQPFAFSAKAGVF